MLSHFSLRTLSGDVLGSITWYISDQDIGSLWFCGDSALNNRLENGGVRNFVFRRSLRRPLQLWPWMVSKFRGLRTFRFSCTYTTKRHVDHTKQCVSLAELETLSPGLVELIFDRELAFSRRDVAFIAQRFPGLQRLELPLQPKCLQADLTSLKFLGHLELRGLGSCTSENLQHLSKTLTKLSLVGMTLTDRSPMLPASITDLTIRPYKQHVFEIPRTSCLTLPPHLTSLNFKCFGIWLIEPEKTWHTIPRSITKLSLRSSNSDCLKPSIIRSFPLGLTYLQITPMNRVFDLTEASIRCLPETLTFLDLGFISMDRWDVSECNKWPGIFPEGLKTLKTLIEWKTLILPPGLTSLSICSGSFDKPLDLPPTLTELLDVTTDRGENMPMHAVPRSLTRLETTNAWVLAPNASSHSSYSSNVSYSPMSSLHAPSGSSHDESDPNNPSNQETSLSFPPLLTSAKLLLRVSEMQEGWPENLVDLKLILSREAQNEKKKKRGRPSRPKFSGSYRIYWAEFLPITLTSLSIQAQVTNDWMDDLHCPNLVQLTIAMFRPFNMLPVEPGRLLDHRAFKRLPPNLTALTLQLENLETSQLAILAERTPKLEFATFHLVHPAIPTDTWPILPKPLSRIHIYAEPGIYNILPAKNNPGVEVKFLGRTTLNPSISWFLESMH